MDHTHFLNDFSPAQGEHRLLQQRASEPRQLSAAERAERDRTTEENTKLLSIEGKVQRSTESFQKWLKEIDDRIAELPALATERKQLLTLRNQWSAKFEQKRTSFDDTGRKERLDRGMQIAKDLADLVDQSAQAQMGMSVENARALEETRSETDQLINAYNLTTEAVHKDAGRREAEATLKGAEKALKELLDAKTRAIDEQKILKGEDPTHPGESLEDAKKALPDLEGMLKSLRQNLEDARQKQQQAQRNLERAKKIGPEITQAEGKVQAALLRLQQDFPMEFRDVTDSKTADIVLNSKNREACYRATAPFRKEKDEAKQKAKDELHTNLKKSIPNDQKDALQKSFVDEWNEDAAKGAIGTKVQPFLDKISAEEKRVFDSFAGMGSAVGLLREASNAVEGLRREQGTLGNLPKLQGEATDAAASVATAQAEMNEATKQVETHKQLITRDTQRLQEINVLHGTGATPGLIDQQIAEAKQKVTAAQAEYARQAGDRSGALGLDAHRQAADAADQAIGKEGSLLIARYNDKGQNQARIRALLEQRTNLRQDVADRSVADDQSVNLAQRYRKTLYAIHQERAFLQGVLGKDSAPEACKARLRELLTMESKYLDKLKNQTEGVLQQNEKLSPQQKLELIDQEMRDIQMILKSGTKELQEDTYLQDRLKDLQESREDIQWEIKGYGYIAARKAVGASPSKDAIDIVKTEKKIRAALHQEGSASKKNAEKIREDVVASVVKNAEKAVENPDGDKLFEAARQLINVITLDRRFGWEEKKGTKLWATLEAILDQYAILTNEVHQSAMVQGAALPQIQRAEALILSEHHLYESGILRMSTRKPPFSKRHDELVAKGKALADAMNKEIQAINSNPSATEKQHERAIKLIDELTAFNENATKSALFGTDFVVARDLVTVRAALLKKREAPAVKREETLASITRIDAFLVQHVKDTLGDPASMNKEWMKRNFEWLHRNRSLFAKEDEGYKKATKLMDALQQYLVRARTPAENMSAYHEAEKELTAKLHTSKQQLDRAYDQWKVAPQSLPSPEDFAEPVGTVAALNDALLSLGTVLDEIQELARYAPDAAAQKALLKEWNAIKTDIDRDYREILKKRNFTVPTMDKTLPAPIGPAEIAAKEQAADALKASNRLNGAIDEAISTAGKHVTEIKAALDKRHSEVDPQKKDLQTNIINYASPQWRKLLGEQTAALQKLLEQKPSNEKAEALTKQIAAIEDELVRLRTPEQNRSFFETKLTDITTRMDAAQKKIADTEGAKFGIDLMGDGQKAVAEAIAILTEYATLRAEALAKYHYKESPTEPKEGLTIWDQKQSALWKSVEHAHSTFFGKKWAPDQNTLKNFAPEKKVTVGDVTDQAIDSRATELLDTVEKIQAYLEQSNSTIEKLKTDLAEATTAATIAGVKVENLASFLPKRKECVYWIDTTTEGLKAVQKNFENKAPDVFTRITVTLSALKDLRDTYVTPDMQRDEVLEKLEGLQNDMKFQGEKLKHLVLEARSKDVRPEVDKAKELMEKFLAVRTEAGKLKSAISWDRFEGPNTQFLSLLNNTQKALTFLQTKENLFRGGTMLVTAQPLYENGKIPMDPKKELAAYQTVADEMQKQGNVEQIRTYQEAFMKNIDTQVQEYRKKLNDFNKAPKDSQLKKTLESTLDRKGVVAWIDTSLLEVARLNRIADARGLGNDHTQRMTEHKKTLEDLRISYLTEEMTQQEHAEKITALSQDMSALTVQLKGLKTPRDRVTYLDQYIDKSIELLQEAERVMDDAKTKKLEGDPSHSAFSDEMEKLYDTAKNALELGNLAKSKLDLADSNQNIPGKDKVATIKKKTADLTDAANAANKVMDEVAQAREAAEREEILRKYTKTIEAGLDEVKPYNNGGIESSGIDLAGRKVWVAMYRSDLEAMVLPAKDNKFQSDAIEKGLKNLALLEKAYTLAPEKRQTFVEALAKSTEGISKITQEISAILVRMRNRGAALDSEGKRQMIADLTALRKLFPDAEKELDNQKITKDIAAAKAQGLTPADLKSWHEALTSLAAQHFVVAKIMQKIDNKSGDIKQTVISKLPAEVKPAQVEAAPPMGRMPRFRLLQGLRARLRGEY